MIEILIVDDHYLVSKGLERIIEFENDMAVVGMALNATEAIRFLHERSVTVVVLDISMPGRSGIDIIRDLKKIRRAVKIIMLSMHHEELFAKRAFKCGASAYLTKEMAPEEIVDAIRKVSSGRRYISSRYAEILAEALHDNPVLLPHARLSDREFEVMCMFGKGKTNRDIADDLHLRERTISNYQLQILEKMNLKSTTEITNYLLEHDLPVY